MIVNNDIVMKKIMKKYKIQRKYTNNEIKIYIFIYENMYFKI